MRIALHLLGTEIFALSWEQDPPEPQELGQPHLDSQSERADPAPIGFVSQINPSLEP